MKNSIRVLILGLLTACITPGFAADQTFKGEIADSSCAMNVHSLTRSHTEMLKGKSMGNDAKSCAQYCVHKFGASYMLKTAKDVYHIKEQGAVEEFAGEKVIITGVLNEKEHMIYVKSIKRQ